ncbi:hypothetical protein TCAL_14981 [Tigriopus californicus]|uniref:Uncharacterized protein n=1 Tax=Tigriopus californicus TaxID=6832 RepID=A0A553N9H9_TIGCA|nr:hypothetical protein TCAL_14981 [Tigriopus californicus]
MPAKVDFILGVTATAAVVGMAAQRKDGSPQHSTAIAPWQRQQQQQKIQQRPALAVGRFNGSNASSNVASKQHQDAIHQMHLWK